MSTAKAISPSGAKETVLLRKPAPKYGFAGRKLPKESVTGVTPSPAHPSDSTVSEISPSSDKGNQVQLSNTLNNGLSSSTKPQQKPVAVVGASFHSHASSVADFCAKGQISSVDHQSALASSSSSPSLADSGESAVASSVQNLDTAELRSKNLPDSLQPQWYLQDRNASNSSITEDFQAGDASAETESSSVPSALPSQSEQLQAVKDERDKLRKELNAQLQVNAELKRLLVASVGDDLYKRVENLCRDRAQLEMDIGGFSKKMSEDYENLDKVSIQADMWRSKYLASRVMTEELSRAKAYFSLQCHDSHTALQQLLNERQELRTNLVEGYKILQQVKNAFDPLNTHRSTSLRSTSVLSLAQACQQLSEAVRFRLLPANVMIDVSADVSSEAWQDSVTRAEQFAQEVLSRPVEGTDSNSPRDPHSPNAQSGIGSPYTRYHPATRYENLTVTCCTRCKGEILVV
ncbi:hypothetical protein EGW08_023017 [Elysia chlorotica]|uniref:Golgin-45 n=1 Tax=Elysia chlorotica TaxID=188477 RepID=A0A433SJF8_ELYCH|nr:hypothetical protein EGW08_023017 [Elysia chlorotica]